MRLMWWGSAKPQRADHEGHRAFHRGQPRRRRRGRERRLGRLLDAARDPDRRRQRARRDPDGLPLHLRIRAPRRARCRSTTLVAAGELDLSGFAEEAIAGGKVDGKIYGVSLGANSSAMIVNTAIFEEAGVALPERGISWDDYRRPLRRADREGRQAAASTARQTAAASSRPSSSGCASAARRSTTPTASSASTRATRARGSRCGQAMRDSGACVPADVQALDQLNIETSMVTLGHAAVSFAHSNQLVGFQAPQPGAARHGAVADRRPRRPSPASTASRRCSSAPTPTTGVAERGGEVRQLLHQRPGGDRGARRRARRAGADGGPRGARADARRARPGADRVHRQPRRPGRPAAAAAAGRAPARSTSR